MAENTKASFETLTPARGVPRFPVLDGWRAISILLVMAGHLFPLGPKSLAINAGVAALGMAIFFTLSGFLITSTLLHRPVVSEFLIRRLCRILPLAWLYMLVVLAATGADSSTYLADFFFYANLPPIRLTEYTSHLWSLCVEMQFYVLIAVICAIAGRRGLWTIPVLCILVTAHRIWTHTLISIVTDVRADEILAGGILALACNTEHLPQLRRFLAWVNPWLLLPLAAIASNDLCGPIDYARPYLVAAMVGSAVCRADNFVGLRVLQSRPLQYIAAISYALYIFHPIVHWGWMESGTKMVKYIKRIPGLMLVFGLSHASTFYYEHVWINLGKRWIRGIVSTGEAPGGRSDTSKP